MGLCQGAVSVEGDGLVVDVVSEWARLSLEAGERDDDVDTLAVLASGELDGSDNLGVVELGFVAVGG